MLFIFEHENKMIEHHESIETTYYKVYRSKKHRSHRIMIQSSKANAEEVVQFQLLFGITAFLYFNCTTGITMQLLCNFRLSCVRVYDFGRANTTKSSSIFAARSRCHILLLFFLLLLFHFSFTNTHTQFGGRAFRTTPHTQSFVKVLLAVAARCVFFVVNSCWYLCSPRK